MKKFNPKVYQNRNRLEITTKSDTGISKIWVWDKVKQEYTTPIRGNCFVAVRRRKVDSLYLRQKATFETLAEARLWKNNDLNRSKIVSGENFSDVVTKYKKNVFPNLRTSTQESYQKWLNRYFTSLLDVPMSDFKPNIIDTWIDNLKARKDLKKNRISFENEFNLLSGILKFYSDYDNNFFIPIKPRHRKAIKYKAQTKFKNKHLNVSDFNKFLQQFGNSRSDRLFYTLATVQFYQSLRISEVAALRWEDLILDEKTPSNSEVSVSQSVYFPRSKGMKPQIQNGFKNSKANGGVKNSPMYKEVLTALIQFETDPQKRTGLIFKDESGELLSYRQVQYVFNKTFKLAVLDFTSTHILRHGGASHVYNSSNGDLSLVKQITGNKDMRSVLVYSHRDVNALKNLIHKPISK